MLTGVGLEPKVVGTAFALGANKMSAPIEGNTGVYVVKKRKHNESSFKGLFPCG
jgi:peptidyl-prolyl cis-trans isomerase D